MCIDKWKITLTWLKLNVLVQKKKKTQHSKVHRAPCKILTSEPCGCLLLPVLMY